MTRASTRRAGCFYVGLGVCRAGGSITVERALRGAWRGDGRRTTPPRRRGGAGSPRRLRRRDLGVPAPTSARSGGVVAGDVSCRARRSGNSEHRRSGHQRGWNAASSGGRNAPPRSHRARSSSQPGDGGSPGRHRDAVIFRRQRPAPTPAALIWYRRRPWRWPLDDRRLVPGLERCRSSAASPGSGAEMPP